MPTAKGKSPIIADEESDDEDDAVTDFLELVITKVNGLLQSRSDDRIDRLNHFTTTVILIAFCFVTSTKQFYGSPIHCWCPAEFTDAFEAYTNSYCWIRNTYYIPLMDSIPLDSMEKQDAEVTYYQWVPVILLFQAFLFMFPYIIWTMLNGENGLNLNEICTAAKETQCYSPDDRERMIGNLAYILDRWSAQRVRMKEILVGARATFSHLFSFLCNKKEGTYLISLYISIKFLYLINVIGQFFLLNAFMATNYSVYGFEYLNMLSSGENVRENPRFPKVTLCDFELRQLQNIQRWTVQCTLPINLYNEKIFTFLWFWFFLLACLNGYSLAKWIYLVAFRNNNYQFVKKYLILQGKDMSSLTSKELCRKFAESYLSSDGCFVARMIGTNSTDLVVMDVLNAVWKKYINKKS